VARLRNHLLQKRQSGARNQHGARQVDRDHALPIRIAHGTQGAVQIYSSVVDDGIHARQRIRGMCDRFLDGVRIGDIAIHRVHTQRLPCVRKRLRVPVQHAHRGAARHRQPRHRQANAAGAAGNE